MVNPLFYPVIPMVILAVHIGFHTSKGFEHRAMSRSHSQVVIICGIDGGMTAEDDLFIVLLSAV